MVEATWLRGGSLSRAPVRELTSWMTSARHLGTRAGGPVFSSQSNGTLLHPREGAGCVAACDADSAVLEPSGSGPRGARTFRDRTPPRIAPSGARSDWGPVHRPASAPRRATTPSGAGPQGGCGRAVPPVPASTGKACRSKHARCSHSIRIECAAANDREHGRCATAALAPVPPLTCLERCDPRRRDARRAGRCRTGAKDGAPRHQPLP